MGLYAMLYGAMCVHLSPLVYAQNTRLTANVSANPIGVGEQFQVDFSANAQLKSFRAPSFDGFTVLSGPNQSTSIQYINGAMTQSITFSYILQAKSEGRFTIGAASAEVGGKAMQSQPIVMQVVKATPSSQTRQQQRAAEQATESEAQKQVQKNLFIKVSTNKTSVMRGEPLVATYKLYTRVSLITYTARKAPAFTGFWNQDLGLVQQLNFTDERLSGQMFRVATVKKVVLFPQQSGILELDPLEADVVARVNTGRRRGGNGSIFDQIFGNDPFAGDPFGSVQDVKLTLRSTPVKINVRSLPSNAPVEFTGGVGTGFHLDASISHTTIQTNEPVKLRVKLSGKGNLKLIEPIKANIPPDIESYDPNTSDNVNVTESGAVGSRTFEYLLIPRYAGVFKIPPVRIAYYDLDQKRYITLATPEFTLTVEKGKDDGAVIASKPSTGQESVTAIGTDIRFIKTTATYLPKRGEGFFGGPMFFAALTVPPLLFFAFIAYRRKTQELRNNILLMRHRGATRMAKRRLKTAQSYLAQNDNAKFHDEIAKALWGYMSDKLSIPPSALTRENIAQTLTQKGVSVGVMQQFALTLDTCEYARFAPTSDAGAMAHLYDDTLALISNIEREIKI
jgi:hypothetical protein